MKNKGRSLFRLGLKRRRKEVRRMRLMMCMAVFFLAFPFLFQDNMNGYQMGVNYRTFGRWVVCSESKSLGDDPHLDESGYILRGSKVYTLWPKQTEFREDGHLKDPEPWQMKQDERGEPEETWNTARSDSSHDSGSFLGALSPGMAEHNMIEIIDGRFPEQDDEIAMELSVLDALGQSNAIGTEISFYVSRFDDTDMLRQIRDIYYKRLRANMNGEEYVDDKDVYYDYNVDTIPGRNELYLVKFKLVGTIERYSTRWNSETSIGVDTDLPGAIVTQAAFEQLEMSNRTYRFFDLSSEYVRQDVWNAAGEVMDHIVSAEAYENRSFALNRNAYDNPLWGNDTMFTSVSILLIVISTCIIAYLMTNYLGKRRAFFLTMREIGATTTDVWKMAIYECIGSVLPVAVLTFAASYLLSFLVVLVISSTQHIAFFYVFSLKTMLTILLSAGLTLCVSMLSALLVFGGRSLSAKSKKLSPAAIKRLKRYTAKKRKIKARVGDAAESVGAATPSASSLPKKHGKPYLGLLETLKRDRITFRLKNRLLTAISVFVCAIVIFCTVQTYQPTKDYFDFENSVCDFSGQQLTAIRNIEIQVPIPEFWNGHFWQNYERSQWSREGFSSYSTFPDDAVSFISSLSGINTIDWNGNDFSHMITFEGKDEDPYFQTYLNTFLANNQPFNGKYDLDLTASFAHRFIKAMERDFYGIYCSMDAEAYWKKYEQYLDPAVADFDAFIRGEQVIAVVDTEMTRAKQCRDYRDQYIEPWYYGSALVTPEVGTDPNGTWYGYRPSFVTGDTLTVLCKSDQSVNVTVAGIVPFTESGLGQDDQRFLTLFGADTLIQQIHKTDEADSYFVGDPIKKWNYNSFEADLDAISANEGIVVDLVNTCAKHNIKYTNNIIPKSEKRTTMISAIVTYGFFGLMLAVLFFFVSSCIAKDEEAGLGKKYAIMSRFGMTVSKMQSEKRLDALRRTAPLLLAFPLQIIIGFISNYQGNVEQIRSCAEAYAADPAHNTTPFVCTVKLLWNGASPKLAFLVIAVFALIYWLIISNMDKEWRKAQ